MTNPLDLNMLKSSIEEEEDDLTGYDISENIIYLMFSLSVNVGIMFIRHTYTDRYNHIFIVSVYMYNIYLCISQNNKNIERIMA